MMAYVSCTRISSAHMELEWNFDRQFLRFDSKIYALSIRVLLNVKHCSEERFRKNSVFCVRLVTFSSHTIHVHVLETQKLTTERIFRGRLHKNPKQKMRICRGKSRG
jgi:hypothetical protein